MLAEIVWDQNSIAVVGVFSIPVIAILASVWSQVERRRSDNELKHSMIERGMSADDIERVMSAKVSKR